MSTAEASARVQAALDLTEQLLALIGEETRLMTAKEPLADDAGERSRLVNAYRLELARFKQEHALVAAAPPALLATLRERTETLQTALTAHDAALSAIKLVTEGIVQAMAEEAARQRGGGARYGAGGAAVQPPAAAAALVDRSA
jgi:hypothetical protein